MLIAVAPPRRRRVLNRPGDVFDEGYDNRPLPNAYGIDPYSTPPPPGQGMGQISNPLVQSVAKATGLTAELQKLANQFVKDLTFKSNLTGTITIQQPLSPGDPTPPPQVEGTPLTQAFLKLAQPAVYINTPVGAIPFEPYGEPRNDYSWLILAGFVGAGVLGGITGYALFKQIACPRRR